MIKAIGVSFKENGKVYHFSPNDQKFEVGEKVIVETERGTQIGIIKTEEYEMSEENLKSPLSNILKSATTKDLERFEENKEKAKEALNKCRELIEKNKLNMYVIDASFTLDRKQLFIRFMADERVDFRNLAKDLANIYKTRIELRQIGVRDEVRKIGGNGICGRELCCCSFLENFDSVSIKMAKQQNIALNAAKISGNCGRLMCCLRYENEVYEEKLSRLPKVGATVKTQDGEGIVDSIETLKEKVRVKLKDGEGFYYKKYEAKDIKVIKDVITKEEEIDDDELKKLESDV